MLQDVVRRWYSGHPKILANVKGLVENAEKMQIALLAGDVPKVSEYYIRNFVACVLVSPVIFDPPVNVYFGYKNN